MPGAAGAYAISTGTIYLNQDWLAAASAAQAMAVLTEELGHHLDGLLNSVDTPGDEGEYFARLLAGEKLTAPQQSEIRIQTDRGQVIVNGAEITVEQASTALLWSTPVATATNDSAGRLSISAGQIVVGESISAADGVWGQAVVEAFDRGTGVSQWKVNYGSADKTYIGAVAHAPDGSIFVTGGTREALNGQSYGGAADGWISKLSSSGQVLWTKNFSNQLEDDLSNLVVDSQGNAYMAGTLSRYGYKSGAGHSMSDYNYLGGDQSYGGSSFTGNWMSAIRKVDTNGNIVWTRVDGSLNSGGGGLAIDPGLRVIKSSYTFASVNGQSVITGRDNGNGSNVCDYLISYRLDGTVEWTKMKAQVTALAVDPSSHYIYVGNQNSLEKLDQAGNVVWSKSLVSFALDIAVDNAGVIHVITQNGANSLRQTTWSPEGISNGSTDYSASGALSASDIQISADGTRYLTGTIASGVLLGSDDVARGAKDGVVWAYGAPSIAPIITLAVAPASVTEDGAANLIYTFSRTGSITSALTVNYTVAGTATLGTDYTGIAATSATKTVTFAANSSTATVTVDPIADSAVELDETVALTLASGTGYTVGTATAVVGTIINDDLPLITLDVSPPVVAEDGSANLVYTFSRSGPIASALTVNYSIAGTANTSDYIGGTPGSNKTITFSAGLSTVALTINPIADSKIEVDETVILMLQSGTGYSASTTAPVIGTILNDDLPLTSLSSATLPSGYESLILAGSSSINGTGNSSDNSITGNSGKNYLRGLAGNDQLYGWAGDDTLDGGLGDDTMNGGAGNDTFYVDSPGDLCYENPGEGNDTIISTIGQALSGNFENLTLIGFANINARGNDVNNLLIGNAANNVLNGLGGIDTMIGGIGNDMYIVDNIADIISEGQNSGIEWVQSSVSWVLGDNLENLVLTGSSSLVGRGNDLNNRIQGNGGDSTLDGGLGRDTLVGGAGADTFRFATVTSYGIDTADRISSFNAALGDRITIDRVAFGIGVASASLITVDSAGLASALRTSNLFVYNTANGQIFHNANGSAAGFGAGGVFALLSDSPTLQISSLVLQ
jgi:hypothetical protein